MIFAFLANTLILIILAGALAFMAISGAETKMALRDGMEKLQMEVDEKRLRHEWMRYKRSLPIYMGFVERTELYLVDKSNIRHFIPFMNFYTLVFMCLLIFAAVWIPVYRLLLFVPSTAVFCFLFAMIPLFILDIMGRYNSEKIRRRLTAFISVLNRWCAVKEDIFYAFERSVDSNIGMPLKTFIRDMVIQVNRGIEPADALDMLGMKVDNPQFKDFVVNIKQSIKYRGNIRILLDNLENQFYKIEEEYNRRRISTYRDRLLTYAVMFLVLFTGYYLFRSNPEVRGYYLGTLEGKSLLTLFCILYAGGFFISLGIMKYKY